MNQSEIYDFLIVSLTTIIQGRPKALGETIFRIYRDIMANYEISDNKLKKSYPKITVDVVAILANGVDVSGRRISLHSVEGLPDTEVRCRCFCLCYWCASTEPVASITNVLPAASISATASNIKNIRRNEKRKEDSISKHTDNSEAIPSDYKQQQELYKEQEEDELIESLNRLTDRGKKDIRAAIARLQRMDILRMSDLCKNYNKLQKNSKLIRDADDSQKFKTALENDIGRELSDYQLQMQRTQYEKQNCI